MSQIDVDLLLKALESSEVEKQVLAVEKAGEIVNYIAVKTVETFRKSPHRFLIAERLYHLGSVVVPPLEQLLKESDNSETSILAAVILLKFGSKLGVSCLLDAVAKNEEYSSLAASSLAAAGIKEAIEPMINRLKSCDLKNVDLAIGLLDALENLQSEIPSDLRDRLIAEDTPWQIRTYAKRFDSNQENFEKAIALPKLAKVEKERSLFTFE
jgi:HEAT repeat protein